MEKTQLSQQNHTKVDGCLLLTSFPSNLIVSPLPSDLWHFQHSSHLPLSHLPSSSSSPAAQVSCRLQPQLLSPSFSDMIKGRQKDKDWQKEKGEMKLDFCMLAFSNIFKCCLALCVRSTRQTSRSF